MEEKKKVVYKIGDLEFHGFARDAGDGLYFFNTEERKSKGKIDLLISEDEFEEIG